MTEKTENNDKRTQIDWEMTEAFYQAVQSKSSLSIEDFIESEDNTLPTPGNSSGEVKKTAEDVKKVLSMMQQGKNTREISESLSLDISYVHNIQMCIQAFPEDNPIAVAHLVLMG